MRYEANFVVETCAVPYARMFPDGRPDLWGVKWRESIPFIPDEQIRNP